MEQNRNPEIQRLLANLRNATAASRNTPSKAPQTTSPLANTSLGDHHVNALPGLGLLHEPDVSQAIPKNSTIKLSDAIPTISPSAASLSQSRIATLPVPDASMITTWPAALKHVTKHIVSNETTASRIRHLIMEQHKHERQWWTGREAILARHISRVTNQQKAAELLKSLGGLARPLDPVNPADEKAELDAFDKKVYKGTIDMAADFDKQLKNLGIPFFAIKHDLVVLEIGKEKEGAVVGRLDKGELRELQRKMVQTLEDLVSDE